MALKTKNAADIIRTDNWRVLVYSKPGQGKTTAISHIKGKVLVIDLDGSSKVLANHPNIDVYEFDREHPTKDMIHVLKEIDSMISEYDAIVFDNFSTFEKDWFVEMGRSSKNGMSNEIQDYSRWTNYFLRVITKIYSLPINIYLTCWEDKRDIELENGTKITQFGPQIRDSVINPLLGLTDVVGRIKINPKTNGHGVILQGNDSLYAKNRIDKRTICKIEELFEFTNENTKKNGEI
jgi:phage nucleotide-binding protein